METKKGVTQKSMHQEIVEAIRNRDLDQLESSLRQANVSLTGRELGHFTPQAKKGLRSELGRFLKRAQGDFARATIYLGDDGLSRLVLGVNESKIFVEPSYNSTDEVKEKWEGLLDK